MGKGKRVKLHRDEIGDGPPEEMKVEVFVPDPNRQRVAVRVEFADGVIALEEPADDDPDGAEKMMDLGSVIGWLTFMGQNPCTETVLSLRHAMEAYRDKWGLSKIMLPKAGGIILPN